MLGARRARDTGCRYAAKGQDNQLQPRDSHYSRPREARKVACECHRTVRDEYERLLGKYIPETPVSHPKASLFVLLRSHGFRLAVSIELVATND
jgi:hypothetical protein